MLSSIYSFLRTALTSPAKWLSSLGRIVNLGLPAQVMLVLFLFLLVLVFAFYTLQYFSADETAFRSSFELSFLLPVLVCVLALPVTAYFATRFWLETPPTEFPEIDEAWESGLKSIARSGLDLRELPLYLGIGISEARLADQLMDASGWELVVEGVPEGSSVLRWYASKKAIIVFLLDVGSTSKTQLISETAVQEASSNLRGTIVGSANASAPEPSRGIRGTIVAASPEAFGAAPSASSAPRAVGVKGTMIVTDGESTSAAPGTVTSSVAKLDRQEMTLQSRRVERVCELASASRLPLCPLNGVLAVVNWNVLLKSQSGQLSAALRKDYDSIVHAGKMYVPLVTMVNGLENEPGFIELVRRVGEDKAKNNRFGHGFNHLIPPTQDQMVALAAHASGAFEDWIYDIFKHPDSLERTNNERLFTLLCKTRNALRPKLEEVLAALATDSTQNRNAMLAGCYFGATGSNISRQAFVRSVIDKLLSLEDDIEWSEAALRSEDRIQSFVRFLVFANASLFLFILGVILYVFLTQPK